MKNLKSKLLKTARSHERAEQPSQNALERAQREPAHQRDAHREGLDTGQPRLRTPSAPGPSHQEPAHNRPTRAHAQGQQQAVHQRSPSRLRWTTWRRLRQKLRQSRLARDQLISSTKISFIYLFLEPFSLLSFFLLIINYYFFYHYTIIKK